MGQHSGIRQSQEDGWTVEWAPQCPLIWAKTVLLHNQILDLAIRKMTGLNGFINGNRIPLDQFRELGCLKIHWGRDKFSCAWTWSGLDKLHFSDYFRPFRTIPQKCGAAMLVRQGKTSKSANLCSKRLEIDIAVLRTGSHEAQALKIRSVLQNLINRGCASMDP